MFGVPCPQALEHHTMTDIAIYESPHGRVEVRVDRETVWLSQRPMAELFDTSTDNIGLHLKRIYADAELSRLRHVSAKENGPCIAARAARSGSPRRTDLRTGKSRFAFESRSTRLACGAR